ncbi:substrate-binding domain-containing protein [Flavisolibacter sp. BT320]|nr:substrate-binding domain-containing protein [Flavisolibacter longurius]
MMVSIKDIAKAVGVSPAAVSLVLNGKAKQSRISDELSAKIEAAALQMGYRPNRVAIGLRTGKSKTLGLIIENIANNFFSTLAKTVEDEARKFGYNVVYCSTENDPVRGSEMIQMLYNQQMDGYVITPASGMKDDIESLLRKKKPVVLIDRYFDDVDVPFVVIDNYNGMREGVEFLIASGYKNIGLVTVDMDLVQIQERNRGYREALASNGLPVVKANVLTVNYNATKNHAVAAITAFIKQRKSMDAVVCATNYLGIDGLQSIKDLGLTIPADLAVLCFDDHDIFKLHTPAITVIEQPIQRMAETALLLLASLLGHTQQAVETKVFLPTRLVKRESV